MNKILMFFAIISFSFCFGVGVAMADSCSPNFQPPQFEPHSWSINPTLYSIYQFNPSGIGAAFSAAITDVSNTYLFQVGSWDGTWNATPGQAWTISAVDLGHAWWGAEVHIGVGTANMLLNINPGISWYVGASGGALPGQYDLRTTLFDAFSMWAGHAGLNSARCFFG
ncbi:MAG: hypothetical protein ACXWAT_16665 [Methylobacter sp.]